METLEKTVLQKVRETIRETEPEKEADAMENHRYQKVQKPFTAKKYLIILIKSVIVYFFVILIAYSYEYSMPVDKHRISTLGPYLIASYFWFGIIFAIYSASRIEKSLKQKILIIPATLALTIVIMFIGIGFHMGLGKLMPQKVDETPYGGQCWCYNVAEDRSDH